MYILFESLGWAGMITFLLAYYGISSGRLKPDGVLYQWMNLLGSIAVSISVFIKHAWPAFTLEVIWGGIALVTLIRIFKKRKEQDNNVKQ